MVSSADSSQGEGSRVGSSTILISDRPSTSTVVEMKRLGAEGGVWRAAASDSCPGSGPRVSAFVDPLRDFPVRPGLLDPAVLLATRRLRDSPPGGDDRLHDSRIRPAAAEIPAHAAPDLLLVRLGGGRQQRSSGEKLARRAEAALQRVVLDERLLQWMEIACPGEPFDSGDG